MELQKYVEEAGKTLKPLGSQQADCAHMMLGIFSELNELKDAIMAGDPVNVIEEIGDIAWYTFNYGRLRSINYNIQLDLGKQNEYTLAYIASKLSDTVKKFLVYNKEIDVVEEAKQFQALVGALANFHWFNTATQEFVTVNIYDAFERNINKLNKVRYKNATYSDQAAQNRDLDAERKALESK